MFTRPSSSPRRKPFIPVLCLTILFIFAVPLFAAGPAEQVIYNFQGSSDGYGPDGGLIADKFGSLYGTTTYGGSDQDGAVFRLSPPSQAGQSWIETVLYSFPGGANNGANPYGTLAFDKHGNLFGTTQAGGPNNTGTVFELSPPAERFGVWTETVLFILPADQSQGTWPFGKLIFDTDGNIYATTELGGTGSAPACSLGGCGTVFELTPPAEQGNPWISTLLYNFGSYDNDAVVPGRGLLINNGSLYGTTQQGGGAASGTIFELTPTANGWSESILYSFEGPDGAAPVAGLIADSRGNLYGTARVGGANGDGSVFELSPPSNAGDPWQENTLYSFSGSYDGAQPLGSLLRDHSGNLYGTASQDGVKNQQTSNNGTVFRLSPPSSPDGAWQRTVVHAFTGGNNGDGSLPAANLLFVDGVLYGTTVAGGDFFAGTIFTVTP